MLICQCGCGEEIPPQPHHKYRPPRYLREHIHRSPKYSEKAARQVIAPPDDWTPPPGLCGCGCGRPTPIADRSKPARGQYKGFHLRYLRGHERRGKRGARWKGGRIVNRYGYVMLYMPGHHLAQSHGYVAEHRLVWEQANGRRLRPDEDVHHIDGNTQNNDPANLVALTKREHVALHAGSQHTRQRKSDGQRRRQARERAHRH